MLKARAFVVAGFVAITLFFAVGIVNSAVSMADNMKSRVAHVTYP